jgi:hypothetical protein
VGSFFGYQLLIFANTGEQTPRFKSGRAPFAIKRDAQQMTLERKVPADRLVADDHTTLEQHLFDITQVELKPEVPPCRMADGGRRKAVTVRGQFRVLRRPILRHCSANVTVLNCAVGSIYLY